MTELWRGFANMAATVTDIGMPQAKKPSTPMIVHVERRPDDDPNEARTTWAESLLRPNWWTMTVPRLALSAKPDT